MDYCIDFEVLEYSLDQDGTSRRIQKRHLSIRESDDDDDSDDISSSTRNTSQKRRNIRSDNTLKIIDGTPLQSSMLKSNHPQRVRKHPDSRGNFILRGVSDPKKRELWKRCFEAITLDHIQRGPAEDMLDSENGFTEPMIRDIQKRYYQMFGNDSPELTEEELRAVISSFNWTYISVNKDVGISQGRYVDGSSPPVSIFMAWEDCLMISARSDAINCLRILHLFGGHVMRYYQFMS